ncbi:MAG: polysaccharide deacetylase family protein [Intrasporangium sp.]|uniref:polysaccharide deacetylase family protein n=1 Tax=Intrasporangium sp. TaxID=1925024 RepID=UPI00264892A3|nr:polysaccharide deacetylase family protein [Intrasporangium sp.]MDN5795496.1 polysaccharide deacetylase family protein [Intrasporangium sp.]
MTRAALVNICFHGIGAPRRPLEPGEDQYWISAGLYEQILDEVAGRTDVRISFDDGNSSDVDIALPGLSRRGMTATFFALAGRLDAAGSLSSDDVRRLRDHGMTIGTHGLDHRSWRRMDVATRHRELVEARECLEDVLGVAVEEAALPMGQYDRTVLHSLKELRYRAVHTSDRRPARAGSWIQPRYSIRRGDTVESVRTTVLRPPGSLERLKREAVGVAKRLR